MVAVTGVFSELFFKLGYSVGEHPKKYIVISFLLAIFLFSGIYNFKFEEDIQYLFSLKNGPAHQDREVIREYFPMNYSQKYTPSRLLDIGPFIRLHITRKDGGSLLNIETWSEIMKVDQLIHEVNIKWKEDQRNYNYSKLCATWNGDCYENAHLGLGTILPKIENGSLRLSYPIMFNPVTFETYAINIFFGGFTFANGSSNTVESVKAVDLLYTVKTDDEEQTLMAQKWEKTVVNRLGALTGSWKYLKVDYGSVVSYTTELHEHLFSVIPYCFVSISLMLIFVMATSYTGDWVTSKPLVVSMGIFSAALAAAASLGFLSFIGVEFIGINIAIIFIALGVGMDDTFVVVAAWWKTNPADSVPQRMAHCYSDAAVSITITTLTDALSFYVGILSQAPAIKIFCVYAGTVVLFIYIWNLLFFGGILALSGYYEKKNRHSVLLWRKVTTDSKNGNLSGFSQWFLIGSPAKTAMGKEILRENMMMTIFKTSFAPMLEKTFSQCLILLTYIVYLVISIWGITQLKEGLKTANLARTNSYVHEYFTTFDNYFREYPYRLQVTITTPLDYSVKENQEKVLTILGNLTRLKHTTSDFQENWLKDFLRFADNYAEFYDFNITTEHDFIYTLRTYYLTNTSYYTEDVKFNENFTKIIATRYIIQTVDIPDSEAEKDLVVGTRNIAHDISDLKVTIYNPLFTLFEMTIVLKSMTLTLVAIAAGLVLVVFVVFNPSLSSTLCVFFSIASIELGVLGFMVLWNIDLDIVSVITLIMCIGFSVDFPAHMSYAYISSKYDTVEERVRDMLHSLGLPILQAATSSLIALCGVVFVKSYIFQLFFKVVSLVMIFSVFHGLFILPVLFLVFKPDPYPIFSKTKTYVVNQ